MRRAARITILRFFVALIAGFTLSLAFVYLFANLAPGAFESLSEFIGRLLGIGFEGAVVELFVIAMGSVTLFSIMSWLALRSWGPLRHQAQ